MPSNDPRLVNFEVCFNFRDLGGYPTSDGRIVRPDSLYRSDSLHRLTPADHDLLATLRLRTVIDLRTETELDDHGSLDTERRGGLAWHHVPLFDAQMRLQPRSGEELEAMQNAMQSPGDVYLLMLGDGAGLARVLRLLLSSDALPAVFHCTSGKDRTGMLAASVLELLGVGDDVIAADYVFTNTTRERADAWIEVNEPDFAAFLAQIPPERRHCEPDTILGFLDGVRSKYGSVEGLLRAHGAEADQVAAFRARLLD